MTTWDRNTKWRQGQLIPYAELKGLLPKTTDIFTHAVVISHDCDLSQDITNEEKIEVILGQKIDNQDGNFTHAKNPRKLHIEYCQNGNKTFVELQATQKYQLSKSSLENNTPDNTVCIDKNNIPVLQRWLAARYRRAAFSDNFDSKMNANKINSKLKKVFNKKGQNITAIFFDVDEGEEKEHSGENDLFSLVIYLVYSVAYDSIKAENEAAQLKEQVVKIFNDSCKEDGTWTNIELVECIIISEEALTYAQSMTLQRRNLDYISLKEKSHNAIHNE